MTDEEKVAFSDYLHGKYSIGEACNAMHITKTVLYNMCTSALRKAVTTRAVDLNSLIQK